MITIKEYTEEPVEYVAYYEIKGYNIEENQDDYIVNELTSWVVPIKRYGKEDIKKLTDKMIIGIHSEYKNDVEIDYIEDALYSITGANENSLNDDSLITVEQIPCPKLFKNDKYYLVDSDEFIDREEAEELWSNGFQGWDDDDYPGTFRKFIKDAVRDGVIREVEFL